MFFPEKIHINDSDLVLEIWPGWSPFYRSDMLFDRFYWSEESHMQTWWTGIVANWKPLLISSHPNLPFRDKVFDYVICSHVLEHIPIHEFSHFMSEMFRVAKSWYIEFPSIFYEKLFHFWVHKNIIFLSEKENRLLIVEKERYFTPEVDFYHEKMRIFLSELPFAIILILYKEFFFIWYEFHGYIEYQECELSTVPKEYYPVHTKNYLKKLCSFLYAKLTRRVYNKKRSTEFIVDTLVCPSCWSTSFNPSYKSDISCRNCAYIIKFLK